MQKLRNIRSSYFGHHKFQPKSILGYVMVGPRYLAVRYTGSLPVMLVLCLPLVLVPGTRYPGTIHRVPGNDSKLREEFSFIFIIVITVVYRKSHCGQVPVLVHLTVKNGFEPLNDIKCTVYVYIDFF